MFVYEEPARPTKSVGPSDVSRAAKLPDVSERRVVRQFVEALLFEGLVEARWRPREDAATSFPESIYDQLVEFELGAERFVCIAAKKAFGRVRVAEGSTRRAVDLHECGIVELIDGLGLDEKASARLTDELEQTVALSRWNRAHLPHQAKPRRHLGFQELETAIVEGHPYHPCFKTRTGFSLTDHRNYGSEAGNEFQLQWVAVARSSLRIALPDSEASFWARELGADEYAYLAHRMAARGVDLREYALVPVHPFQFEVLSQHGFDHPTAVGDEIVPLGPAGDFYRATQSLRTLMNASRPERPHVKLPLDIVCTSSRRNLEPHFVCTAPLLSAWLGEMVAGDPYLEDRLLLLHEYAGILYERELPEDAPPEERERALCLEGLLGTILRESVLGKLDPGEAAIPFTALTLVESDGRPFVADWLERYGAKAWAERLVEVTVLPLWHMLVHHGVAFEAHAQNLILVHEDGWPAKLVLRDFHEDTEFVPDFLREPERAPAFERVDPFFETIPDDDGYRMASTDALRQLYTDTVYVFNLADVSFLLELFAGLPEEEFWDLVVSKLDEYARSGVTAAARIERMTSDEPEMIVESLLHKKIQDGDVLDYFEHAVVDTLAARRRHAKREAP